MLLRYKKILLENYASPKLENYKWLFLFISVLFVLEILATIKNIIRFGGNEFLFMVSLVVVNIIADLILFWLIIKALKNPEVFNGVNRDTLLVNQLVKKDENRNEPILSDESSTYIDIIKKLENHMKVNEPLWILR
jgi:hypothetical protein